MGHISNISDEALIYGQETDILEISTLASKLYFYNRLPLTFTLSKSFPSSKKTLDFLFMGESGNNNKIVRKNWKPLNVKGIFGDAWSSFNSLKEKSTTDNHPTYKLYLSTDIKSLREILVDILDVLSFSKAFHFKFGKRITELLRPDNFMIYFKNKEDLMETADKLKPIIEKSTQRGTPFTSELFMNGLLSWGKDPRPKHKKNITSRYSWRSWICMKLAASIIDIKQGKNDTNLEPWLYAKEALSIIKIDANGWTPTETLWEDFQHE